MQNTSTSQPTKHCHHCDRDLPATEEYFYIFSYRRKNLHRISTPVPIDDPSKYSAEQIAFIASDPTDEYEMVEYLSGWCKDCLKRSAEDSRAKTRRQEAEVLQRRGQQLRTAYRLEQEATTGVPPDYTPPAVKICRGTCGKTKPADLTHFCPDSRKRDGLSSWCRECLRIYNKNYRKKRKENLLNEANSQ